MTAASRRAPIHFIFVTILLDAIGMGLLIPVLPDVLRRFTTDPSLVSEYYGYFLGAYAFMQFLASPVLGSLSDRYGRRPVLLLSLMGAALDYLFMAWAPNLSLLFLGRVISGLTGASMTVAGSYMVDISDDSNRSANFGMIGAAWGIGFIAGPLLGGLLASFGPNGPFIVAAIMNFINFLFGLFVLPESLAVENRRVLSFKKLNPLKSIIKVFKPSPFVAYIWLFFMVSLAGQVHPVNWTLYTETKFQWSSWEVGLSLSFVGVVIALAQGLLTRILIPKMGEQRALTMGLTVLVLSFALFSLASAGWMMYAIMLVFSLSCVTNPALQSLITRHIPPQEQGELQGSLVSLGSLAAIISPLFFTKLFVTFTAPDAPMYFPGAAYLGASLLSLIALGVDLLGGRQGRGVLGKELAGDIVNESMPG